MKMMQVEIRDQYKIWGIYDVLEAQWNHKTKELMLISVNWFKSGQDLMIMDANFDNTFSNVNGRNLTAKII